MSTDQKPSDDFTALLLIVIVIVYFGLIIPGVRLIRSKYIEPPQRPPASSTLE